MSKFSQTDDKLKSLIRDKGLSSSRIRGYDKTFKEIHKLFNYTPSELLEIARSEEKPFIDDNNQISIIEMDDRTVYKVQSEYFDYITNEDEYGKSLKPKTILNKMATYRSFLSSYDIELPRPPKIPIVKVRIRDRDIPTWQDVKRATELAKSPRDRAAILFCATTGLRVSDVVSRKISDLIEACEIYFEEDEPRTIETLLSKDPDNIVPCWELNPQKTENHSNLTLTYNTPETTALIFDYLNYRIALNEENGRGSEIGLDEPLFASQRGGFLNELSLQKQCSVINEKMGGEKDKNGLYGKFRLHNLRKLFKTTCRRNLQSITLNSDKTFDGDVISLFTGHITPNNPLADVYEAVEDDSHDSYIRKIYQALIPYLSIYPTETKAFKEQQYLEMEEKIGTLEEQSQLKDVEYQRDLDEKNREIELLRQQLEQQSQQIEQTSQTLTSITKEKTYNTILEAINNYVFENLFIDNPQEEDLIVYLATDYAVEHKDEFEFTDTYIKRLINRIKTRISLDGRSIAVQYDDYVVKDTESLRLQETVSLILQIISTNSGIMELIGEIEDDKLEDLIEIKLSSSNYDIDDLSKDDVNKIIEEIVMDYID